MCYQIAYLLDIFCMRLHLDQLLLKIMLWAVSLVGQNKHPTYRKNADTVLNIENVSRLSCTLICTPVNRIWAILPTYSTDYSAGIVTEQRFENTFPEFLFVMFRLVKYKVQVEEYAGIENVFN